MLSTLVFFKTFNIIYLILFFFNKLSFLPSYSLSYFFKFKSIFYLKNKKFPISINSTKNTNFFLDQLYDNSRTSLGLKSQIKSLFFFQKSFDFLGLKKKFYNTLLDFFFVNSFFDKKNLFTTTGFYRMFFFKHGKHSPFVLNLNKILLRWVDFFNLLLNLFFYQTHFLIFSSPFFKQENLSINWNISNYFLKKSWNYVNSYFLFKTNKISDKNNFFFKKIKSHTESIALVSDITYHYQNTYYLKKNNFFIIGLVPLALNPWLVHYPVFAASYSYLNQLFFLQVVVFNQKKASFLLFIFFKKIWIYLKNINN